MKYEESVHGQFPPPPPPPKTKTLSDATTCVAISICERGKRKLKFLRIILINSQKDVLGALGFDKGEEEEIFPTEFVIFFGLRLNFHNKPLQ